MTKRKVTAAFHCNGPNYHVLTMQHGKTSSESNSSLELMQRWCQPIWLTYANVSGYTTTYLINPAMKPENFLWSSSMVDEPNLVFKSMTKSQVAVPVDGPCLVTASTKRQTLVGIFPNDVITSGFMPSDIMACKAGQTSWNSMHRAYVESFDSASSWYDNNLSTLEYSETNSPEIATSNYYLSLEWTVLVSPKGKIRAKQTFFVE